LLQRAQDTGYLGREQRVLKAQHLVDLHRRALQLAEVVNNALGVAHEVCELVQLTRRPGADEGEQLLDGHRRPDASDEAPKPQEPLDR
jgi:hypothetical protein